MGFFDKLKEVGQKAADGLSKTVQTIQVNYQENSEAHQIKKRILLNLSLDELKGLAYLVGLKDIEYKTEFDPNNPLRVIKRKVKFNKFDYIERVAKKPYADLSLKLRHLHKSSLADEMEREISFIEKRYGEKKKMITEGVSQEEANEQKDILLQTFIETITDEIIAVSPEKCKKEREYEIELKGTLKGVIKKDFPKSKVSVEIECPTKTGRRIDIMIQIDNYKIGIETKYNLSSSSNFQRVMGQVLEYSNFLDALMIVQYSPLEDLVGLNNLKGLKENIKIPLKVIANGNVKI